MAVTKYLTQWIDVPHEPGERFQFRKPNWVMLEDARAERTRKVNQMTRATRETLGPEVLKQIQDEIQQAKEQAEAKAGADPEPETAVAKVRTAEEVLNDYDRLLLLKAGIQAWTYCEPKLDADGNPLYDEAGRMVKDPSKPIPVNLETLSDLDEPTQNWAGLTLLALRDSGFRPIMPEVVQNGHGEVIEVRPGQDDDPFAYSSSSNGTWTASPA